MNEADAEALGVAEGELVEVASRRGMVRAPARHAEDAEVHISLTIVMQASKELRDDELPAVCIYIDEQNKRQQVWLVTQIERRARTRSSSRSRRGRPSRCSAGLNTISRPSVSTASRAVRRVPPARRSYLAGLATLRRRPQGRATAALRKGFDE